MPWILKYAEVTQGEKKFLDLLVWASTKSLLLVPWILEYAEGTQKMKRKFCSLWFKLPLRLTLKVSTSRHIYCWLSPSTCQNWSLTLSCPGLVGHSQPGEGSNTPCNSFIWPSINLKLGTSIGMSKNAHTQTAELCLEMTWQWCHFPFLQLLCFLSDFAQILHRDASWCIANKNTKFCWD